MGGQGRPACPELWPQPCLRGPWRQAAVNQAKEVLRAPPSLPGRLPSTPPACQRGRGSPPGFSGDRDYIPPPPLQAPTHPARGLSPRSGGRRAGHVCVPCSRAGDLPDSGSLWCPPGSWAREAQTGKEAQLTLGDLAVPGISTLVMVSELPGAF